MPADWRLEGGRRVCLTKYLHTVDRVQSSVWRLPNYWPPTPFSTQRVWGTHSPGRSICWKTPDIGLASYSIIPLRFTCTVIRCTVVSVNGKLVEDKCVVSRMNVHILASTSVPLTLTMVQVPNLALIHTERITVWGGREHLLMWWLAGVQGYSLHNHRLMVSLTKLDHPSKEGRTNTTWSVISLSLVVSLPPLLFIHHIFQPLVWCERKNKVS